MTRRPYTPRPYGGLITGHVLDVPRCAVFAGMGMGKTVATLTAIDIDFLAGEDRPALVLAPKRVARSTWPAEALKWDHLRHIDVSPAIGDEAQRIRALKRDVGVYTINYDNVPWLVDYYGSRWPFGRVVSDESTRLKSFRLKQGGKRAQALGKVAHVHAGKWVNLTGTPAPNGLQDLWGQTWYLDSGVRLGRTFSAFEQRWFRPKRDGYGIEPLPYAQQEIEDRLRDICLSLDPKDYFDIRDPIVTPVYVELPSKARAIYRSMEREMYAEIESHPLEAFNAASRTIKCLQLANGAAYIDDKGTWVNSHDAKLEALESIIEEAAGMPVLVAYHFKSDLARILKAFPQARELDDDPQTEADWNAGKIPILVAHPASAGHGLNLQDGGNILVFFGHWWDLEQYQQIIERIGPVRQLQSGHDRAVFIYLIIARDTMDETVMLRRENKREVQDLLLESLKMRHAA